MQGDDNHECKYSDTLILYMISSIISTLHVIDVVLSITSTFVVYFLHCNNFKLRTSVYVHTYNYGDVT